MWWPPLKLPTLGLRESRLVELAQQMQAESEAMKDEITTIQNDLQSGILTPDSPERMRLEDQLLEKANAFRATQRTMELRINSENARILEQLHGLAQKAMASLSAERGWTVVLPRTPFTVPESLDPNIVQRDFGPIGLARRTCRGRDHDRDQPDERVWNRPTTAQNRHMPSCRGHWRSFADGCGAGGSGACHFG